MLMDFQHLDTASSETYSTHFSQERKANKVEKTQSILHLKSKNLNPIHLGSNLLTIDGGILFFDRSTSFNRDDFKADLSWLIYLSSPETELTKKQLVELISGAQGLIREKRFDMLDDIIEHHLKNTSPVETMVALLRVTFPFKRQISSWKNKLKAVEVWLRESELDGPVLLKGLL